MSEQTGRKTSGAAADGFEVAGWIDRLGGFVSRHPGLWIRLGTMETRLVGETIADIGIDRPVYIAGLARSGSTILLETLARHDDVATHRYRDYPMLFTPYLWNRWLDHVPTRAEEPAERTHGDGIAVTSDSPEAFEEMLWMAFFPGLHESGHSAVLDRTVRNPAFETFYRDHLRKLLAARGRRRYVAKGNYNVTRLGYLKTIAPDARFIVPVRDPVWHIASLMKQHELFVSGQRGNEKARRHLARVGHFEFGLDRRAIDTGDEAAVADIARLWTEGEEVRGWARYWALVHNHLADVLEADGDLREATRVVRYETLCGEPRETIASVLAHCGLEAEDGWLDAAAAPIRFPGYYKPRFDEAALAMIAEETEGAARRFGYGAHEGHLAAG